MLFKILADVIVFIHFLWILFLISGALLGRRVKTIRIFHISGLIFAIFIQIMGWYCPLTYLEVWLRSLHDPSTTYPGSFIIHYVEKLVYLELSPLIIFTLTVLLSGLNLWIYLKPAER